MNHRHFVIHKPYGFLSQFITNQHKRKKRMLGELYDFPEGTMAIGRLDATSEGLLLLTTDGMISERIRNNGIEKEYHVQLDGEISDTAIHKLTQGITLLTGKQAYTTLPCKTHKIGAPTGLPTRGKKIRDDRHGPTSWISITITEGKFRQVRKMTAAVGFPTLRLIRVRIGTIHLQKLFPGDVLEVNSFGFV